MHQFNFLVSSHAWHILYQWNGRMHYAVLLELEHTIIGFSAWINYNECAVRMHWSTWKLRKWHFSVTHFMYCGLRKEHLACKKKTIFANVLSICFDMIHTYVKVKPENGYFALSHSHFKINHTDEQHLVHRHEAKRIGIVFNFYFYLNYLFRDIFKWRCWQNVAKKQWDIQNVENHTAPQLRTFEHPKWKVVI